MCLLGVGGEANHKGKGGEGSIERTNSRRHLGRQDIEPSTVWVGEFPSTQTDCLVQVTIQSLVEA